MKIKFLYIKKPISIYRVYIKRIVLSSKESYCNNKYYTRYDTYYDGIIPLFIKFLPMSALTKYYKIMKI